MSRVSYSWIGLVRWGTVAVGAVFVSVLALLPLLAFASTPPAGYTWCAGLYASCSGPAGVAVSFCTSTLSVCNATVMPSSGSIICDPDIGGQWLGDGAFCSFATPVPPPEPPASAASGSEPLSAEAGGLVMILGGFVALAAFAGVGAARWMV